MITALLAIVAIVLGVACALLSLENDFLHKNALKLRKAEEDRVYKLFAIKQVQEKIAYLTDPEKVVDIIMASMRNIIDYSAASSVIVKDAHVIFKIYIEDNVGTDYVKKVEESMLGSFERLIGRLPPSIESKLFGKPLDDTSKSIYSSSYHMPLIANNKILALIHLSSLKQNAYLNMEDFHEFIDAVSSSLTHFSQAINVETEKLSSLISSIPDGILMVDNKNNLLEINSSAKRLLGVQPNVNYLGILDALGQNFGLAEKIKKVILGENPSFEAETLANGKSLNIRINPVGQDKVSVVLRDITDLKKKEMQKEDLIHIMVHELRAPATTIKDSSELLITSQDSFAEDRKMKFLEIIHTQAKKVLGQIGSILDTAKLDAGKLVLQKTKGDIEKLVNNEVQAFMPQAQKKNISINVEVLSKSIPQFSFDELRIEQVIDNFLSNSLKFTPENGKIKVELDYRVIPPVLDGTSPMKEFLSLDKFIVVSVSDSGIGITPEQQKLLFAKYTQAKNTPEKLSTLGTGLGLYLVKGIIESHEGRVWVKSAMGQGTTFFFSLPTTDGVRVSYSSPNPTPLAKLAQTVN